MSLAITSHNTTSTAQIITTSAQIIPFPAKVTETTKEVEVTEITNNRPHEAVEPIKDLKDIEAAKAYLLSRPDSRDDRRNYMMFVVNINNAVRISDLLKLKIKDVLDDEGNIVDEVYIRESKTKKTRYLFFGKSSKEAIAYYLDILKDYSVDDYLFESNKKDKDGNSKPISRQNAWRIISNMGKAISEGRSKSLHLGTHSMRKTFGYQKIKQNPDDAMVVAAVSEMYNHKDMKTTYRYLGLDIEAKRDFCTASEL